MNKITTASAAIVLSALSFGAFAADSVYHSASDTSTQIGITKASDVEAGLIDLSNTIHSFIGSYSC